MGYSSLLGQSRGTYLPVIVRGMIPLKGKPNRVDTGSTHIHGIPMISHGWSVEGPRE